MLKDYGKESGEPVFKGDPLPATLNKNLRRSERVFLNLRVRVSATADRGEVLLGEGQTIEVSHDGAAIMVDGELRVGQTVKIRRVGVNKEALARVVGSYYYSHTKDPGSGARVFGVVLADNRVNFWDIFFPAAAELGKAVLRALLRCVACGRLEVSYLNEFESDLFLNHHSVARLCGQCGGWTTWTRPYGCVPVPEGTDTGVPLDIQDSESLNRNRRSHFETVGCIRNPASGNEVVLVSDLSPGGLSFVSANQYPAGTHIEMAVPYTSKAPNIYSLVRIVDARKGKESNLTEYRAAYLA